MDPQAPTATPVIEIFGNDTPNSELIYLQTQTLTTETTPTQWNQLKNRFASSSSDLQELADLLNSWNLGDLYDFFVDQHLYVGILKHLSNYMAQNIFNATNVPMGVRVEFFFQWSKWIKSSNESQNENPQTNENPISNENPQPKPMDFVNAIQKVVTTESKVATKSKKIILYDVLKSNAYGNKVMEVLQSNEENKPQKAQLNENLRKVLCEAVLQYCIEQNYELTKQDCASLTEEICKLFPDELASYYYVERKGTSPLGKLYNKYRNWKNNLARKSNTTGPLCKKAKNKTYEITANEDEHIRLIKTGFSSMSYEEKMVHWAACAATRMNLIKDIEQTSKQVIDIWPQYKSPDGFRLIDSDFNFLYGSSKDGALETLNEFCETVKNKIFPKYVDKFKNSDCIELYNTLNEEENNLEEDAIQVLVFQLIQALLPLSRITKKALSSLNNIPQQKKIFYSVKESRNSFVLVCRTELEYKEMYDCKVRADKSVAPYISLIGTTSAPEYFMVDFENITYKFFKFVKALDICFKSYYVFNLKHPEASEKLWKFMDKQFYQMPNGNSKIDNITDAFLHEIQSASKS